MSKHAKLALLAVALICAAIVSTYLAWDSTPQLVTRDLSISPLEYEVWLMAIAPYDRPNRGSGSVLCPHTLGPRPRHCVSADALGDLVLCLEGSETGWVGGGTAPSRIRVDKQDADRTVEAVRDFAAKSQRGWLIENEFRGAPGLRIATAVEIGAIEDPDADQWREFDSWFPEASELVHVSRVGFSTDGQIAVVEWAAGRAPLSGRGALLVLKFTSDGWQIVGVYGGWKS